MTHSRHASRLRAGRILPLGRRSSSTIRFDGLALVRTQAFRPNGRVQGGDTNRVARIKPRGISYISCRCRRGKDRCGRPFSPRWPVSFRYAVPLPPTNCSSAISLSFLRWMLRVKSSTDVLGGAALFARWRRPAPLRLLPLPLLLRRHRQRRAGRGSARRSAAVAIAARSAVAGGHLQEEQVADGLVFDAIHHVLEQREGFLLVLDQRIFLAVSAQADAFLEVVHRQQVIFPLVVDDVEHDDALGVAHVLGADQRLLFPGSGAPADR